MDEDRLRQMLQPVPEDRALTPEQKLMSAVLARALSDALCGTDQHDARLARCWLLELDGDAYDLPVLYVLEQLTDQAEEAHNAIIRILNDPDYDPSLLLGTYGFQKPRHKNSLRAKTS